MKQHCILINYQLFFIIKKFNNNKFHSCNYLNTKKVTLFSILIILITLTNIVNGQVSFAPYQTYSVGGSRPDVVCIGDVNNDNLNDVVVASGTSQYGYTEYKLYVFLQDNAGHLISPAIYNYPHSNQNYNINSIAISDMNNDGLNDVIVGYDTCVGIFYQNAYGTLNSIQRFGLGMHDFIYALSIGDLNHDGLKDIAICGSIDIYPYNAFADVLYQNNTNNFYRISYSVNQVGYRKIEVVDFNNDQLDDMLLFTGSINIYIQNINGNLNSPIFYPFPQNYDAIGVGDLNNDSVNDIVITSHNPLYQIILFFQDTISHLLQSPLYLQAYHLNSAIKVTDLNCDGRNEIIVAPASGWDSLSIYEQDINNVYNSYTLYKVKETSTNDHCLDVGDINNDGKKDIATSTLWYDGLCVLINQSTSYGNCCILPSIPAKPFGDTLICQNSVTSTYKPITSYAGNIYWNLHPAQAGNIISSNNDSCLIAWNNSWHGTADIYIKNTNSCGSVFSDTLNVYINKPPIVYLGNDTILCKNDTLILLIGSNYLSSYLWSNNSTDSTLTVTIAGTYFVETSNICGKNYDTITVQIVPLPTIHIGNDTIFCSGTYFQYDVSLPGNNNYIWQDNSTNPVFTVTSPGIYSVTITDSNNCQNDSSVLVSELSPPIIYLPSDSIFCGTINMVINLHCSGCSYHWQDNSTDSVYAIIQVGQYVVTATNICGTASDTIFIQSVPLPPVNLGNDTFFCSGTSFQYDVSFPGNNNYIWQDNSTNPVFTVTSPGIYSVTITDSNNCHNQKSVSVGEIYLPTVHLPGDTTYCDTINLVLNVFSPECSYHWQDNSTDSVYTITHAGQYNVTVTNVCGNSTDSLIVNEIPLPAITLPDDTSFCAGEAFVLNVTQNGNFPYHYHWQDGSTGSVIAITSPGYYSVIISDSVLCQSSKTIKVDEFSAPVVNFPDENSICSGNQIILDAFNPNSNYLWQDGSTLSQYFVQDSGIYTVIVNNICGSVSDSTKVIVNDCTCYLDVPSAFSPNGDENNDVLYAVGRNVENINFIIFDRWGKKVFESKSLSIGWDGTFKGKKLDANVFMYHISATSIIDGHSLHKEGNISLIR